MQGADPTFTVLLPTHDRADVLPHAIRSVLAQTQADFELIVVADGCTDDTVSVVRSFDDPRIVLLDLPKAPFFGYANRNVAMQRARGRYVAYAPHDDLLLPDHLQRLGALLDGGGLAFGYSLPVWVSTAGVAVPACSNLTFPDEMARFRGQANTIPACCIVHSRSLFEQVGGWPENLASGADWLLWRRMLDVTGGCAAFLSEPTTLHFTANWRTTSETTFAPLRHALGIIESGSWWPAILRHEPLPGRSVQEAYAQAIAMGGLAWCSSFRSASDRVVGRFGWTLLLETAPRLAHVETRLTATEAEAAHAASAIEALHRAMQALEAELAASRCAEAAASRTTADACEAEARATALAGQVAEELRSVQHDLAHDRERGARAAVEAEARARLQAAEIGALTRATTALGTKLKESQSALDAVMARRSWRVMAPFRWLAWRLPRFGG